MKTQPGEPKFDYRTRERALREGKLSKEELKSYLKSLPDEANKGEEIPVYDESDGAEKSATSTQKGLTFSAVTEA
ncbi:MAG: hypothetical protein A2W61_00360 [Deltaproteobacteria bacterium RIFCSPLOWO2_01_44_7]|nr:MAG: hypothetical protein A2712_04690 [Deltaproteobacteria bacterium RIFCSPHIGHO2_01_FULL_43_49]OGQ16477.1 MAG: hypothetical protein A3D22_02655 [Deltaproteobacteria bacterium RIFCSPHIGHO2_02_FULL_44_53]OGQ27695.1 MAG: hypothetical protein A3D98_08330 [Deltaproteobacteria bacterium RIFCSPHIGHO2_12_FULL_44_21]OGQ32995.1 MAG: hypothetical protein A2979_10585 [Deltaproteobacteria bacterium RIFCSPLOWO2_01_FULL_45_74]OGQ42096.1 MAG: hypothetical protein A3I70_10375 [Deltaproteobacteria bacterium 